MESRGGDRQLVCGKSDVYGGKTVPGFESELQNCTHFNALINGYQLSLQKDGIVR